MLWFLFNKQALFWPATLLKRGSIQVLSYEYSEIFKNTYFEVDNLENEIYSYFLMSEAIHSLLEKVKKVCRKSFTGKGIWYSVKH